MGSGDGEVLVEELGGMVGQYHTGVQWATVLGLLQPLLINTRYHITLSSYAYLSVSPPDHEFMGAWDSVQDKPDIQEI